METFSYAIKVAFLTFPFVALLFTIPYIIHQYHKYGSVSSYRTIIIYSFLLYMITAYFLVILPLPSIESVSKMTTPSYNLIPFQFIREIFSDSGFIASDFATYFPTLKNPAVYESLFNVLLTIPFGVYLHYYFEFSFKKTLFYSFCLTLFFELTQATGLYFIYPRSYRIFDADDLILNTLGGVIGYIIAFIPLKILPTRKEIDENSLEKGARVGFIKRVVSFGTDFIIYGAFLFVALYLTHHYLENWIPFISVIFLIWSLLYYVVIPSLLKGKTLSMKFFHLEFTSSKKVTWFRILSYYFWMIAFYILLPLGFAFLGYYLYYEKYITRIFFEYFIIVIGALTLMMYLIALLKRIFKMSLLYEKISHIEIKSSLHISKEENLEGKNDKNPLNQEIAIH